MRFNKNRNGHVRRCSGACGKSRPVDRIRRVGALLTISKILTGYGTPTP